MTSLDFEGVHILSTGTVYALAESTGYVYSPQSPLSAYQMLLKAWHRSAEPPRVGLRSISQ